MIFSFRRSYLSLWNRWLLFFLSLVLVVFPRRITDMAFEHLHVEDVSLLASIDIGLFVLGVALLSWSGTSLVWNRFYSRYTVYEDRLEARHGILRRRTSTASFSHIRSIDIDKTLPGMLLGYGDLLFGTAGTGETNVVLQGVADPEEIKERIRRLQSSAQNDTQPSAPAAAPAPQPQPSETHSSATPSEGPAPTVDTARPEPSAAVEPLVLSSGLNHPDRPGSNPLPYDGDSLNDELDRRIQQVSQSSTD